MHETVEAFRPEIETISLNKETESSFSLGKNGPIIEIKLNEESPTGLSVNNGGLETFLHFGVNTVGRLPENDIVVSEPTVSRKHATITVGDNEYSVSDTGSANGTYMA